MARRDTETGIGGPGSRFPLTRGSAIAALQSNQTPVRDRAFEALVTTYWKPVYKYLRIKWRKSNEDAKDLTQAFFTRVLEKEFFRKYDPSKSRFRTFLRTCLDGFTANEAKAARTQKRGGDVLLLPLDFHQAEAELKHVDLSPDECFEKEWVRSLFSVALEQLRHHCDKTGHQTHFRIFEKYDIDRDPDSKLSYRELSLELGIPETAVTNYLAYARREFRKAVLQKLRETTGSEEEFRNEARRLLGAKIE